MDSNEEYLDQLLRSLTEGNSSAEEEADDGIGDLLNQFSDEPHSVPEELISDLMGGSAGTPENAADEILADLPDELPEDPGEVMPDIPEEPELPELSDIPGEPELSELPELSEALETLDAPEPLEMLDVPEMPTAQEEVEAEPESLADDSGEDDDLGSLLESLGAEGDEDVREISDLLGKAERDEPIVDIQDAGQPGGKADTEEPSKRGKRKKKERVKKERVKKEKKPRRGKKGQEAQTAADSQPQEAAEEIESLIDNMQQEVEEAPPEEAAVKEKKQGFWGKLLNTLTQEEEETEDPAQLISDENGEIMEQLDKEDKSKAKDKKKKKDKKDKKGKGAADAGDDEELEEAPDDKKKKKKEKKPKKEKPAVAAQELLPGKKLSLKKILPVVLVSLVLCAAYVLVSSLYISHVSKQRAEEAYYEGDYLECYGLLFGQDLSESQAVIYHKSELALQMERMKGNYQRLVLEGKELEALDYLVQSVCRREEFYRKAQEWGSLDTVEQTFTGMAGLLKANYGMDEARAMEIAALESDVDYTLALLEVLERANDAGSSDGEATGEEPLAPYEDLLPEEEEITDTEFVDTIG